MKYSKIFPKDEEIAKHILQYYDKKIFSVFEGNYEYYAESLIKKYLESVQNILVFNARQTLLQKEARQELTRLRKYLLIVINSTDCNLKQSVTALLKSKQLDLIL